MHERVNHKVIFLPEVAFEQEWDQLTCIKHLMRKAGYYSDDKDIQQSIITERYESLVNIATYSEYIKFIKTNEEF